MIEAIKKDVKQRMEKSLNAMLDQFSRIRTGRANTSILDNISVDYYGAKTPLKQLASIVVEDTRTLSINVWEKNIVIDIEKAIMASDLGLNPAVSGTLIRVPMPSLTEETRKQLIRQAKSEAEGARVAIRNNRRNAVNTIRDLSKEKSISDDDEHAATNDIQKLTDHFIAKIDTGLQEKEVDLMVI